MPSRAGRRVRSIPLKADYAKSVQQVFQEAAERIMSEHEDLFILHGQPLLSRAINDMPSWVPDWSVRRDGVPAGFLVIHYMLRFCLAGKIGFRANSLFVDCFVLDTIAFATDTMSCENFHLLSCQILDILFSS